MSSMIEQRARELVACLDGESPDALNGVLKAIQALRWAIAVADEENSEDTERGS